MLLLVLKGGVPPSVWTSHGGSGSSKVSPAQAGTTSESRRDCQRSRSSSGPRVAGNGEWCSELGASVRALPGHSLHRLRRSYVGGAAGTTLCRKLGQPSAKDIKLSPEQQPSSASSAADHTRRWTVLCGKKEDMALTRDEIKNSSS